MLGVLGILLLGDVGADLVEGNLRAAAIAVVNALGLASPQAPGKIGKVELLGYKGELKWKQEDSALKVEMPAEKISEIGITLKVELA